MTGKHILLVASAFLMVIFSCKKEKKIVSTDCRQLKNAISTGNKKEVKTVITKFISSLSSQNYTEENLTKLATAIGQTCGLASTMLCFDCIKTLPSQTEIRISFGVAPVEKTIDITYTSGNKMIFHNLHD